MQLCMCLRAGGGQTTLSVTEHPIVVMATLIITAIKRKRFCVPGIKDETLLLHVLYSNMPFKCVRCVQISVPERLHTCELCA